MSNYCVFSSLISDIWSLWYQFPLSLLLFRELLVFFIVLFVVYSLSRMLCNWLFLMISLSQSRLFTMFLFLFQMWRSSCQFCPVAFWPRTRLFFGLNGSWNLSRISWVIRCEFCGSRICSLAKAAFERPLIGAGRLEETILVKMMLCNAFLVENATGCF